MQYRPSLRRTLLFSFLLLGSSLVWAEAPSGYKGAIASAHPQATEAGIEILRQGGNAADAAAAVAFALAVVEPYSSGIGGGGFATTKFGADLQFIDFRETAPAAANEAMYLENGEPRPSWSRDGKLSVGTPGAVAGYLMLHKRYGKLSRKKVLAPAIRLAKRGFKVGARFQKRLNRRLELLKKDEAFATIFLLKGARGEWQIPPIGHVIVQKDLGKTLKAISKKGAKGFYQGKVGALLAEDMKRRGGILNASDLKGYRVRFRKPLIGKFMGKTVISSPPPSSGGQILITILNLMEGKSFDAKSWHDVDSLHWYIEASKRAFADRALLGDPEFVEDITPELITKVRSKLLAQDIGATATLAKDVKAGAHIDLPPSLKPDAPNNESHDTTHFSVIDAQGNAVAMTTTVNYVFGAGIVAAGTGVVWNDEMDDFSIAVGVENAYSISGSKANAVAPAKVPLSSMSPTLVLAGDDLLSDVLLIAGSPGGPRIPTTTAQIILNVLVYGAPIDKAIALGRIHHQHLPDLVSVEDYALDPQTRRALEAKGHVFKERASWSNAMAISIDPKTKLRTVAADPRGIGSAMVE